VHRRVADGLELYFYDEDTDRLIPRVRKAPVMLSPHAQSATKWTHNSFGHSAAAKAVS
jgi:hypothetical protein